MKPLFPILLLVAAATAARANLCGLPVSSGAGAGLLSGRPGSLNVSVGLVAGVSRSTTVVLSAGFQTMSLGAYTCFLSTDTPLAVQAYPGSPAVQRLVPNAGRTVTLEWTESLSLNPVTYSVFVGTSPIALASVASGLAGTSEPLTNLSYQTVYYWRVVAADQFGRAGVSHVYAFSIVPVTDHLIAAPNPFHPGNGTTTFLFSMAGAGSATMEIYSLPDARRVLRQRYDGLQDGANTITYDGRDSGGRYLPNGVYTVRLIKNGANGNATELFKLVSAR